MYDNDNRPNMSNQSSTVRAIYNDISTQLDFLNGSDDYANGDMCGTNTKKYKIAFSDDNNMEPLCSKTNSGSMECKSASKVICAYPYVGPLSIQNNANFCEDGYEPSIWTNPKMPIPIGGNMNMNRNSAIGTYITKIDDSSNNGKPVWCVSNAGRNRSAPVIDQTSSDSSV